jgi:membrane-bound lytic murein transglycosylase F
LRLTSLIILLFACILLGCSNKTSEEAEIIATKKNDKIITFVTINSPNTYYINERDEYAGLEYDLAKLFVSSLGPDYQARFIVVDSFAKVIPTILENKADIAAADISITENRKKIVHFSTPFQDVQQQVIYNSDITKPPKSIKDLTGRIMSVPAGTSFVERLRKMKKAEPGLTWKEVNNTSSELLIEAVANEEVNFTVADSHLFDVMQYYHPNIRAAFPLGNPEQIAWAVSQKAKPELLKNINTFFKTIKDDGTLRNLIDRYHGNTKRLKPFDVKAFLARTQTRLPPYIRIFKNAQDITDVDWRLLAAISYQESHWDTYSTSPTNVRGLMMLTEGTSDMMKVDDRLDPKQSIPAGAKFFLWLKERLPARIPEPDLTFMALAAYNVGVAHVEDARVLAQRLKLNPDSWADVKKALPLLSKPEYYSNAKYGYCSCGSAVIYTDSIRSYHQILKKYEPSYDPDIDPFKIASM